MYCLTRKFRSIPAAILAAMLIAIMSGCTSDRATVITGYAQGGWYSVKCRIPERWKATGGNAETRRSPEKTGDTEAEILKESIDSILAVVESAVSGYNPQSLLSRFNRDGKLPESAVAESDDSAALTVFEHLTAYCDSLYVATDGVLDTRAAALFDVWGFGFKTGSMPSAEEVSEAMLDRSRMNFNAVAQGYSADLVAGYLTSMGISDFMVNIGGEIACNGTNFRKEPWTIGIDRPEDGNMIPGTDISLKFRMPDGYRGVVTSGNYRKFYVRDGVKYSHTIDPRIGKPVSHDLLSATVIAPTSALADALATYCMVIGLDEARKFILSRDDLEGCLISSTRTWISPGMNAMNITPNTEYADF